MVYVVKYKGSLQKKDDNKLSGIFYRLIPRNSYLFLGSAHLVLCALHRSMQLEMKCSICFDIDFQCFRKSDLRFVQIELSD